MFVHIRVQITDKIGLAESKRASLRNSLDCNSISDSEAVLNLIPIIRDLKEFGNSKSLLDLKNNSIKFRKSIEILIEEPKFNSWTSINFT